MIYYDNDNYVDSVTGECEGTNYLITATEDLDLPDELILTRYQAVLPREVKLDSPVMSRIAIPRCLVRDLMLLLELIGS